ncbi:hypothetical protein ACUL07_001519 [Staphylococcus pseudintermedius]|nr:hypothetical protein [Staphylococcus pseudintermedius]EHT3647378.1 hypothetical protein [Staphylococcus pseudintermedius]
MKGIYTIVCWECNGDKHFEEYYFESHEDAKKYLEKKGFEYKEGYGHFKSRNYIRPVFAAIRGIPKYEEDE